MTRNHGDLIFFLSIESFCGAAVLYRVFGDGAQHVPAVAAFSCGVADDCFVDVSLAQIVGIARAKRAVMMWRDNRSLWGVLVCMRKYSYIYETNDLFCHSVKRSGEYRGFI
ncbi:unnamed protein product [Periconia digitata]|uniref:Uncharacterized protein n=1 Tax=Periconia digitata TaxID=1303443 RepID=A0A9W4UD68_9PLEO|nr:unnamed protein product [Periconia digitata]